MNQKYDKKEIIKAGEKLFRSNGFRNTGVNDILHSSGISKGAFYNHFSSKEDFAKEVVEYYGAITQKMIIRLLSDKYQSPLKRIENFYSHLSRINESEGFKNGCLVNNFSLELGGLNNSLATVLNTQFRLWVDIIADTIREGQEIGEITQSSGAEEIATNIHTIYFGFMNRAKVSRSKKPLDTALTLILGLLKSH